MIGATGPASCVEELIAIFRTSSSKRDSLTIGWGDGHDICVFDRWVSRDGHA